MKLLLGIIAATLAALPLAAEKQWLYLANAQALGGQGFYEGQNSSFDGNFSLQVAPSLILDNNNTIVNSFTSSYRGVRTVEELAGGGFLIQETWENLLTGKWVKKFDSSPWIVKPKLSAKLQFNNESKSENFGDGLFDYHKFSASTEFERKGERWISQRLELAAYSVIFPNYEALSSFESEIQSGVDVLNFYSYDASYAFDYALGKRTLATIGVLTSWRPYPDQYIVTNSGTYAADKRHDLYGLLRGALYRGVGEYRIMETPIKVIAGIYGAYALLDSDQNSFDASQTIYTEGHYDYKEAALGPSVDFMIGAMQKFSLTYSAIWRNYDTRLVRDLNGVFHNGANDNPYETVNTRTQGINISYSWLFTEKAWGKLSLLAKAAILWSRSNMAYEATYTYNYDSAGYLIGLGWELPE
ncbi:MAG: hypothetical protein HY547_00110 [Elusimicrobia bacterium]|nr:hypothetical protein [Elusimicrobiota bacterium]